jgi:hypothetical protein
LGQAVAVDGSVPVIAEADYQRRVAAILAIVSNSKTQFLYDSGHGLTI